MTKLSLKSHLKLRAAIRSLGADLGGVNKSGPAAPVIAIISQAISNRPQFSIDLDETFGTGDSVRFQFQISGGNWSSPVSDTQHVVLLSESGANTISLNIDPVPNGTIDARAMFSRATGGSSGWSNVVTFTVSVIAVPTNATLPAITGDPGASGNVLTASKGVWNGTAPFTYAYQWQKAASNIPGATSATYTIQAGDAGASLTCIVTATNSQGSASATSGAFVVGAVPASTVAPAISGFANPGQVITASTGTWSGQPANFAYQWKSNGTNIVGATSATYTVVSGDLGNSLTCSVTASNGWGSASASTAGVTVANPAVFSFVGQAQRTNQSGNVFTSNTIDIGSAAADRYVIVAVFTQSATAAPTVTVNGVSLSIDASAAGANNGPSIFSGLVTTGSGVATIVVTWASGTSFTSQTIHVWTARGMTKTNGAAYASVSALTATATVSVKQNDFVISATVNGIGAHTATETETSKISSTNSPTAPETLVWNKILADNAAFSIHMNTGQANFSIAGYR